jgi:putative toxin-antitoxin system antitoxin component (TIGR02293 family)
MRELPYFMCNYALEATMKSKSRPYGRAAGTTGKTVATSEARRSSKNRAGTNVRTQARAFAPDKARSVLRKWYRPSSGGERASEALNDALRLASKVASGFPTKAVDDVIESGLVEPGTVYELVVPRRTLADRKQKGKPLSAEQSDRLARVLRVYARAEEAIGDASRAHAWLHKENRALEGRRPVDLVGSDAGTRAVEKVLGRIEYGVVS